MTNISDEILLAACHQASVNWTLSGEQIARLFRQVQSNVLTLSNTGEKEDAKPRGLDAVLGHPEPYGNLSSPHPTSADKLEVVAWEHTLHMDGGETAVRLARAEIDKPWGKPGIDFDESFHVTVQPLVRQSDATRITAEQAERIAELEAEIERMTPKFVAYDYLESPAGREMAEAECDRMKEMLERAAVKLEGLGDRKSCDLIRAALNGGAEK